MTNSDLMELIRFAREDIKNIKGVVKERLENLIELRQNQFDYQGNILRSVYEKEAKLMQV